MTEAIRISAVIPVYNRERTISRAIDSVLGQERPASEIVVVDDGSIDGTRQVVQAYGEKVRYVYQANSGVAAARNKGVATAQFEWIAFLDSDDYWLPHHLKRACEVIKKTKGEASLYFSDLLKPDANGCQSHWELCGFGISGDFELRGDASEWALLRTQPMMLQTSVIRRDDYRQMGGIPVNLLTREDTYLFYWMCFFRPACAVSGFGAAMSSDGNQSGRLTIAYDGRNPIYHECTKLLYKELLNYRHQMSNDHRKAIQRYLVWSHLHFGRILLKEKQVLRAIPNILGGVYINPVISVELMIGMLKDYYSK